MKTVSAPLSTLFVDESLFWFLQGKKSQSLLKTNENVIKFMKCFEKKKWNPFHKESIAGMSFPVRKIKLFYKLMIFP